MAENKNFWIKELGKKFISFGVGGVFNFFIGKVIANFIEKIVIPYIGISFSSMIWWVSFFTFIFYFGWCGIRKIEEFWCGIPVILGQPIPNFILPSGYFWQLPEPIMSFLPVYQGRRDLDLPTVKALSRDQIEVTMDAQIQARVTNPYEWIRAEEADKMLITLGERNLRILINSKKLGEIPGLKQEFSRKLEEGVPSLPVYDENGEPALDEKGNIKTEELKSVKEEAKLWGFNEGIDKCIVNKITIPEEITKAKADAEKEKADTEAENIQQNLVYSQLGAGDIDRGKTDWLSMPPSERAMIMQAERKKRKVFTVDGNADGWTKGQVASAAMKQEE